MDQKIDDDLANPDNSVDLGTIYQLELDAAHQHLNADRIDLLQLLGYIHTNKVLRRRVSVMLKSAWNKLVKLRLVLREFSGFDDTVPELNLLLKDLNSTLNTGETVFLSKASSTLEKIHTICLDQKCPPETTAKFLGAQALALMSMQKFGNAAELFEKAATVPGLNQSTQWQYQNKRALALVDLGREYTDNTALERAVELYETKILALAPQNERPADWVQTQCNLADALGVLGHRHRGTHILERSIDTYKIALSHINRSELPDEWATTQNNFGNALGALGQRQGDKELLEKSIAAFEAALEERSDTKTPDDWASSQNNLGAALHSLGAREEGTKLLSKSVAAYTKVLKVWTRQSMPLEWAAALNNLGTVLRVLGDRQSGTRSLEKSVAAFKNALEVRTSESFPQDWAMTQNNLGAALQKLAENNEGTDELEAAIVAYVNALQIWTREKMPMGWTMTMANLGVARRTLAERTHDLEMARRAVDDISVVTEFFRDASHAQYRELSEEQLTKAREVVEKLGG